MSFAFCPRLQFLCILVTVPSPPTLRLLPILWFFAAQCWSPCSHLHKLSLLQTLFITSLRVPSVSYQDTDKYSTFVRIRKRHPGGYMWVRYTVVSALVCIEFFKKKTIPKKKKKMCPFSEWCPAGVSFVSTEFRLDFSPIPSLSG